MKWRIRDIFFISLFVAVTLGLIVISGLNDWPPAPAFADKHDGEFELSESCKAQMGAIFQKMIAYEKAHGHYPPADTFWPACVKEEIEAALNALSSASR